MTVESGLVTVDTTDAIALGTWWRDRLDATIIMETPGQAMMIYSASANLALGFQQVAVPTPGKNRIHLDLQSSTRERDVEAFIADGAIFVQTHTIETGGEFNGMTWTVLADPDGNVFCIADKVDAND